MIATALFAFVGIQQSLPANLVPASEQELFLTQTFYELDDSSRAEQHEFRLERKFSVENGKSYLTEKRWLAGWIIGDIRLDDPIKPAPIVTKWEMNPDGTFILDTLKHFQVEEFRIDRLRWFLPPTSRIEPLTNWKLVVKGNPAIQLTEIHYRFFLNKSEKVGDFVRYSIVPRSFELRYSNRNLTCDGNLDILVKGNTYLIENGEWTTPSTHMIGNNSDRFKLVQKLTGLVPKSSKW